MRRIIPIIVLFTITITQYSFAQIPQTMSYQGVVTGTDGVPVPDGNVSLTFRLYNSSENGDTLWQETQNVQVTNGIFNVILGSNSPLNLPFDKQYWLGISIGGDAELTPRTALTASPYSLNNHSTIAETEPGQGLTIRDSNGNPTHQFDANGDVMHAGIGTFLGGIVAGDTTIHPDTSLVLDTLGGSQKIVSLKKVSAINEGQVFLTTLKDVGGYGEGDRTGLWGFSDDGTGVRGRATSGTGVYGKSTSGVGVAGSSASDPGILGLSTSHEGVQGHSTSGVGVFGLSDIDVGIVGRGPVVGVWAKGKLKVDDVPQAPNQERFLVWDADKFVKYRMLPPGEGSFNGTLINVPFTIKNAQGDTAHHLNTDGSLYSSTSFSTLRFDDFGLKVGGSFSVSTAGNDVIKIDPGSNGQPLLNVNANSFSGAPAESVAANDETAGVFLNNSPNKPAHIAINFATDATAASYTGNVLVNGNLSVLGDVFKGGGGFKIDHPLDPADKYLTHSFVESPQRMNVYNGNVQLDASGEAWVELPQWFEALNKDFRYQLTCIGGFAQVYIAQEIQNNRFKIAGGTSGLKISWQVTGVRHDAFAKTHPLKVEEQKGPEEAGKYLQPEAFGLPQEQGIFYSQHPEIKNIVEKFKNKDFKSSN